jgi:hypothetical protein
MPAFPTLVVSPTLPVDKTPRSNCISSPTEAGYNQRRPRFTRKVCDFGPIKYPVLTTAEKDLIQNHFDSVGCTALFLWTMPMTTETYQVYYKDPGPVFSLVGPGLWSVVFSLEGV